LDDGFDRDRSHLQAGGRPPVSSRNSDQKEARILGKRNRACPGATPIISDGLVLQLFDRHRGHRDLGLRGPADRCAGRRSGPPGTPQRREPRPPIARSGREAGSTLWKNRFILSTDAEEGPMNENVMNRLVSLGTLALGLSLAFIGAEAARAADDPPLVLARDGFMYVGGKTMTVDGREYFYGQMYVEIKIPANRTHPYPIIMVHGGTMSGTNYTGTPDGREGWAQYFVRRGYAVYVVDQPGRGRSGFLTAASGEMRNSPRTNSASRFVSQEKFKLWPQAALHTQWPGSGEADDPATLQLAMSQLPAIEAFA